ncbi:MAG TPA: hypothetical protein VKU03_13290, partial [Roseiarcus sp.]|nr:hypothetical protein [Roseiarcus sp.]
MSRHEIASDPMRATLRESRMVVERLCQSIGVPDGVLRSVTDCGVYSAALGLSGYPGFERQLALLQRDAAGQMSARQERERIFFDGGGRHAWFAAEPALDLLVSVYRIAGAAEMVA